MTRLTVHCSERGMWSSFTSGCRSARSHFPLPALSNKTAKRTGDCSRHRVDGGVGSTTPDVWTVRASDQCPPGDGMTQLRRTTHELSARSSIGF